MRADLHIHTYYSDGKYSPREIAERAAARGVVLLSMTDHDTLDGLEEKRAAAEACGLLYAAGFEISAYTSCKVHVLGYNCRADGTYAKFSEARREGAVLRARESLSRANRVLGLSLTLDDVRRRMKFKDGPIHTMHIVDAFAEAVHAERGALYAALFDVGKPAYSDVGRPTPFEAVRLIHDLGGFAVLAHAGRIALDERARLSLMDSLVAVGLDGIECYHSQHTARETEYFLRYAEDRGLLVTGGSDFHADGAGREIGSPAFDADDRLAAALGLRR